MEIVQPNLTSYQKDILFSDSRFTVTVASTKAGKTYSHIIWLYGKAHEHADALGYNYWWVAPVYGQARIAFNRMRKYLRATGLYKFNQSALIILCPNGAEIHFKSADNPDNLYGEDVYAAVFDEASRAREESWFALRSTLTATEAPCKLIGNYKGQSNWMSQLRSKAVDDDSYEFFQVTCWQAVDAGILSLKEVEQAKRDLPPRIFKELYEAEPSDDDGQLISNESIDKLFSNTHLNSGIKYITADIARLGKDRTVIGVWDGLRLIQIQSLDVSTVDESVNAINALKLKYNVNSSNIIVDEDGVGGGTKDYLRCLGFRNGSRALKVHGSKQNFANLKSQCYWRLAEVINRNEMYVDTSGNTQVMNDLIQELEWVRLAKDVDVQAIRVMGKDQIKKNIGRSPDYSDMLMMRMYWELDPHKGKYYFYS